jgi:hypothetical protein
LGKELYDKTDLERARETYEEAFRQWRKVVDEFPDMVDDHVGGSSMEDAFKGYYDVLQQLDEPFPKDFPIKDVMRAMLKRSQLQIPAEYFEESAGEIPLKPTEENAAPEGKADAE